MKKFDLYEALLENGFEEVEDSIGRKSLHKHYEKEVEVCWYGKRLSTFDVAVHFNSDRSYLCVYYYDSPALLKRKEHYNNKRAYNAIRDTLENKGYQL